MVIHFYEQFDPHKIKLLIFDLDGTLIDSRLDLIHSVNAMLRHLERPELPGDLIASYVGNGAPMLVRRALGDPEDENLFNRAMKYFLAYYHEHKLDYTHAYDGMKECLAAIKHSAAMGNLGNGIPRKMAVLSNKPVNPARAIVQALGLGDFFEQIYGGNSFSTKKPDPQGAQEILKEAGVDPQDTLMVGDSAVDVMTGRNAGLWVCAVTYGLSPHSLNMATPDVAVDTPQELAQLFGNR